MTIRDLYQLEYLRKEISLDEQRLSFLRGKAYSASTSVLTDEAPGPHENGDGRTARYAVALADLRTSIEQKRQRCIELQTGLERFIDAVPDSQTRLILILRFSEGLTWRQVAQRIGGGNSEDSVKKRCYRYLASDAEDTRSDG